MYWQRFYATLQSETRLMTKPIVCLPNLSGVAELAVLDVNSQLAGDVAIALLDCRRRYIAGGTANGNPKDGVALVGSL